MTSITRAQFARLALGVSAAGLLRPISALASTDQQELVQDARTTINEARHDQQFGNAPDMFRRARAVMVVPKLVKGGLVVGGEGGNGVLLQPQTDGGFGQPLFYTLGSVSLGFQIGLEVAELILFVMTDKALRAWTTDEVKLGADAGLTVLVIGSNAEASATTNGNVDVIAWAKSKGAYAGLTLKGSVIKPKAEWNTAYYGHAVSPAKMLKLS